MLKRRFFSVVTAVAIALATIGAIPVVADSLGLSVTPQASACEASGTSGGGC